MTQRKLILATAVMALTFGLSGQTTTAPVEPHEPLSDSDILIVENQSNPAAAQTDEDADESAKMGKEEGTHTGEAQGATPDSDSDKIDQTAREQTTDEGAETE